MDNTNHNTFTNVTNTTWNKMETTPPPPQERQQHNMMTSATTLHHHHHHHQIPMPSSSSIYNWPNNNYHHPPPPPPPLQHHHQMMPAPSSPSSSSGIGSSSSLFSGILGGGIQLEEEEGEEVTEEEEELGPMKEMMYKMAAMQPVEIDPATLRKPKRRNVRISDDPQSVAARHRRERISERIRILQRLVPGGTKMDTASMLEEAVRYVKFLKRQIRLLQSTPPSSSSSSHPPQPPTNCIAPPAHWPFPPTLLHASAAAHTLPGLGFPPTTTTTLGSSFDDHHHQGS